MIGLYNLPAEIHFLISKLPANYINQINIDPYVVETLNLKQGLNEFGNTLLEFKNQNPDVMENSDFRNLLYFTLIFSEQMDTVIKINSDPQNGVDVMWNFIAEYLIHGTIEFLQYDESVFNDDKILDRYFLFVIDILDKMELRGEEIADYLDKLLTEHPSIVMKNQVVLGVMNSVGFTTLWGGGTEKHINNLKILDKLYSINNYKLLLMHNYHKLGILNNYKYNSNEAINYYNKCKEIADTNNFQIRHRIDNNIAVNYMNKGNYSKAEELFLEILNKKPNNITPHENLVQIYLQNEQYQKALKFSRKIKELRKESTSLEKLMPEHQVLLEMGNIEEATVLYERAIEIVENHPHDKLSENLFILMEARQNFFRKNYWTAFKKYDEVIEILYNLKLLHFLFTISFEKLYKQIEYLSTNLDDRSKDKIIYEINSLIQLSDEQGIPEVSSRLLFLRGQLYYEFDLLEEAKKELYNAHKLADKFEFHALVDKIQELRTELFEKEKSSSLWGSIKSGIKSLLGVQYQGRLKEKDYLLHGVIILSKSGIPLYDKYFSDRLQTESTLVSGLIAAVSSFMDELVKSKGFLKSIQHDDLSLILETVNNFVIVSIVSDETFDIRNKTKRFGNDLREILDKFNITDHPGEITANLETELRETTNKIFAIT